MQVTWIQGQERKWIIRVFEQYLRSHTKMLLYLDNRVGKMLPNVGCGTVARFHLTDFFRKSFRLMKTTPVYEV